MSNQRLLTRLSLTRRNLSVLARRMPYVVAAEAQEFMYREWVAGAHIQKDVKKPWPEKKRNRLGARQMVWSGRTIRGILNGKAIKMRRKGISVIVPDYAHKHNWGLHPKAAARRFIGHPNDRMWVTINGRLRKLFANIDHPLFKVIGRRSIKNVMLFRPDPVYLRRKGGRRKGYIDA